MIVADAMCPLPFFDLCLPYVLYVRIHNAVMFMYDDTATANTVQYVSFRENQYTIIISTDTERLTLVMTYSMIEIVR